MILAQTDAWTREYKELVGIPTSSNKKASSIVEYFVELLRSRNIKTGTALEIGCGLGRNSIFLARNGFRVWAFDIVEYAIKNFQRKIEELNLPISTSIMSASEGWFYEDSFFDLAIDICVFDNMVTKKMKDKYLDELFRVLKPGGYFCMLAILADDGYYAPLLKKSDKKEEYILYDSRNQMWSSMLPKEKVRDLLVEKFKVIEERDIIKKDVLMYGKKYERKLAMFVVQK